MWGLLLQKYLRKGDLGRKTKGGQQVNLTLVGAEMGILRLEITLMSQIKGSEKNYNFLFPKRIHRNRD